MKQEALDANFADIVTLPIMPEPQNNPFLAAMQVTMKPWGHYAIKDRILGKKIEEPVCALERLRI